MSPTPPAPHQPSTAELVGDILSDAQTLVSQQLELFKEEVRSDFQKTLRATAFLAAGAGFLLASVPLLGVWLAYLFHAWGLTLASSFGLATLIIAVVGVGLVLAGRYLFASFNPLPDETVAAAQENVEWLAQKS